MSERVGHFEAAGVDVDVDVDVDVGDGADDGVNVAVFEDALPKASLEAAPLELLMLMTTSMLVMMPMTLLIFSRMLS